MRNKLLFITLIIIFISGKIFSEESFISLKYGYQGSEEFIIPIKYGSQGQELKDGTYFIRLITIGNKVFTRAINLINQNHWAFKTLSYPGTGYSAYRDGTNLILDISVPFNTASLVSTFSSFHVVATRSISFYYYSFYYNYLSNDTFRKEIKRLADFLDENGAVWSMHYPNDTYNSILSNSIYMVNYTVKYINYKEQSQYMKHLKELEYIDYKLKFQIGNTKFEYEINRFKSPGQVELTEWELEQFQAFLVKKKIDINLLDYVIMKTDDIEKALRRVEVKLDNYKEVKEALETEYSHCYILDLKDFIVN